MAFGAISYLNQRYAAPSSSDGHLRGEADNYRLYLVGGMGHVDTRETKLTTEQAATQSWENLVKQAGIDYE